MVDDHIQTLLEVLGSHHCCSCMCNMMMSIDGMCDSVESSDDSSSNDSEESSEEEEEGERGRVQEWVPKGPQQALGEWEKYTTVSFAAVIQNDK